MNDKVLKQATELARKIGYVTVATADARGIPHVAIARNVIQASGNGVLVKEWFCPGTIANLAENGNIAIVVWDPVQDTGCQLIGVSQKVEDVCVLDGYDPVMEPEQPIPQVESQVLVKVEKVMNFTSKPHSDKVLRRTNYVM